MKDRDGKRLKIGDKVLYFSKSNTWLIGIVNAFGENLIVVETEEKYYSYKFYPLSNEYVIKATQEQLMLYKLEN